MKRKLVGLILLVVLLLVGCSKEYREDYTVEHEDLLDEYLGEWEVLDEYEVEVLDQPFYISDQEYNRLNNRFMAEREKPFHVPTKTYLKWNLGYTDAYGEKQIIVIDNLYSIEEGLIDRLFEKLNAQLDKKLSENMNAISGISDPFIGHRELNEPFETIEKLYGDALYLKSVKIENVFEGTPIYAKIWVDREDNQNLTENQFDEFLEEELNRLLHEIPHLNAVVSAENKHENKPVRFRYFVQGKEIDFYGERVYAHEFGEFLKEHFPEFLVLEENDNQL